MGVRPAARLADSAAPVTPRSGRRSPWGCWALLRIHNMKEYKTVSVETQQGWAGSKGTANTATLDATLNTMAKEGWELVCVEDLIHTAGTGSLLCVFSREAQP